MVHDHQTLSTSRAKCRRASQFTIFGCRKQSNSIFLIEAPMLFRLFRPPPTQPPPPCPCNFYSSPSTTPHLVLPQSKPRFLSKCDFRRRKVYEYSDNEWDREYVHVCAINRSNHHRTIHRLVGPRTGPFLLVVIFIFYQVFPI